MCALQDYIFKYKYERRNQNINWCFGRYLRHQGICGWYRCASKYSRTRTYHWKTTWVWPRPYKSSAHRCAVWGYYMVRNGVFCRNELIFWSRNWIGSSYPIVFIGRGERIRTSDPRNPIAVRYQAALHPDKNNLRKSIIEWMLSASIHEANLQALRASGARLVGSGFGLL